MNLTHTLSSCCFTVLFFLVFHLHASDELGAQEPVFFPVRVLLQAEESATASTLWAWQLNSPKGFVVEDCDDPDFFEEFLDPSLTLTVKNNLLVINGRRVKPECVRIRPREGNTTYGKYTYAGTFLFMRADEQVYLINSVDIEEYLFSVLRWEGWPGWPAEVNKVFAVMCRTYVVNKLLSARRAGQPYDIKKSNMHQTYNGVHEHDHLWDILQATQGIVMVHNGQVIEAMYDACCGGIVPGKITGYNFEAAPYLKRMKPCTACKETKLYSWQAEYSVTEVEALLSKEFGVKIKIADISVSKRDKAGVVQEIIIKAKSGIYKLNGKRIYALFKKVKSLAFDTNKKGNKIIFKNGRGYGHHMGVCQWGVRQKVREKERAGKLHPEIHLDILKDYYVGISFMNIQIVSGV